MPQLSAATHRVPTGLRSISDDDLCSGCGHCLYAPGETSGCPKGWPGQFSDGYCVECPDFIKVAKPGDNWVPRNA